MNTAVITELDKILPVVVRVHGENHPELIKVLELYNELKANPSAEVFATLRDVTSNYTVPADACPTFGKTYQDLAQLDREFA